MKKVRKQRTFPSLLCRECSEWKERPISIFRIISDSKLQKKVQINKTAEKPAQIKRKGFFKAEPIGICHRQDIIRTGCNGRRDAIGIESMKHGNHLKTGA